MVLKRDVFGVYIGTVLRYDIYSENVPFLTAEHCEIRIVFGHDIHFNPAVSQRFMVDIEFIVKADFDLVTPISI